MKKIHWITIIVLITIILCFIIGYYCFFSKAEKRFKEIFDFEIPKGVEIKRYHFNPISGYTAFDLAFNSQEYNDVTSVFMKYADDVHARIIDEEDAFNVNNIPVDKQWYQKSQMEYITGFKCLRKGRHGARTGTLRIVISKENNDCFHVIIDY